MGNKTSANSNKEGFGCGIPPMKDVETNDFCRSFYVGMGLGLLEFLIGIGLLIYLILQYRKGKTTKKSNETELSLSAKTQKGGNETFRFLSAIPNWIYYLIATIFLLAGIWTVTESMRGYYYLEMKPAEIIPVVAPLPNDGLFTSSCTDCAGIDPKSGLGKKLCTWTCSGKNEAGKDATCSVLKSEETCSGTAATPTVIATPPVPKA
jgi:hypothetical protein